MKQLLKSTLVIVLALIMVVSSLIIVTAEEIVPTEDDVVISSVGGGSDSPMAYELVWKYKYGNGHLYRRRWNATLGAWYDPEWILVW